MSTGDIQHDRVAGLLAAGADVEMPESVAARIEDALQAEVDLRQTNADLDDAKRSYLEMGRRSALGTFGENVPARYDRSGVGIAVHDTTHHPHRGRGKA